MTQFEDITDEFFELAEALKPQDHIRSDSVKLTEALLVPEFFSDNLDISEYLEEAFVSSQSIEANYGAYLPENQDVAVLLIARDYQKVLNGAKPHTLFYHSVFHIVFSCIYQKKLPFLRQLVDEHPALQACVYVLKSIELLQIYYEAISEYLEHGDDLEFQIISIPRHLEEMSGNLNVDQFLTECIEALQPPKEFLQVPHFYYILMLYIEYLPSDRAKEIKTVANLLPSQTIEQVADFERSANYEETYSDYNAKYYDKKFSAIFAAFSDGEISITSEELKLCDLCTIIAEVKKQLPQLSDNVENYVNDTLFGHLNNCLFAFHRNSGLFDNKEENFFSLSRKSLKLHYSRAETGEICVSNDLQQFEEPFFIRLANLTLFYCQKDFTVQQLQSQLLSVYLSCAGKTIAPVKKVDEIQKLQDFCKKFAEILVELQIKLSAAHSGRLERIFKEFIEHRLDANIILENLKIKNDKLHKWVEQLIDFVYIEFGAVPYVTALQFSILTIPKYQQWVRMVLRELTAQSYNLLALLCTGDVGYALLVQNENFQLLFKYLQARYLYYSEDAYLIDNTVEFTAIFKIVIHYFKNLQFNTKIDNCEKIAPGDIKKCARTATVTGIFECYSKYSKTRLEQIIRLFANE